MCTATEHAAEATNASAELEKRRLEIVASKSDLARINELLHQFPMNKESEALIRRTISHRHGVANEFNGLRLLVPGLSDGPVSVTSQISRWKLEGDENDWLQRRSSTAAKHTMVKFITPGKNLFVPLLSVKEL